MRKGAPWRPKFDADGLITCVVTDAASGDALMVAHMNAEALADHRDRRCVVFSRSRQELWRKGETSGHTQRVLEMRIDCDQDAIWIRVEQGRRRPATPDGARVSTAPSRCADAGRVTLEFKDADRLFDPNVVYAETVGIGSSLANPSQNGAFVRPRVLTPRFAELNDREQASRAGEVRPVVHHAIDADDAGSRLRGERRDDGAGARDRVRRRA